MGETKTKFWINLSIASQNDSLFRSAPIGSRIKNHLIQIGTSKRVHESFSELNELTGLSSLKVRSHQMRLTRINRSIRAKLDAWTFWVYSLHSREKFASFASEIRYTTDAKTRHGRGFCRQLQSRCKMYSCFCKSTKMYIYSSGYPHTTTITLSSIVVWDFLPPLVMTSLLEQAPDWLTRREYPPKFRFFDLRDSLKKNAQFAPPHSRE